MALPYGRRIAIDPGSVRIGLAATDATGMIPAPRGAVAPEQLLTLLREFAADSAVIYLGMPKHLSGQEGTGAAKARELARLLQNEFNIPIYFVDERLTSKSAAEIKRSNPEFANLEIDALAALELLRFALQGEAQLDRLFGEPA